MNERLAWVLGAAFGSSLGVLLGVVRGDVWVGGAIAVCWTIASAGAFASSSYTEPGFDVRSRGWSVLVWGFPVVAMLVPLQGPLLGDVAELPAVFLLGGLWAGGVYAGIALERQLSGDSRVRDRTATDDGSDG